MTTRVAVADRAIRLGGFALAHAALCIADGFGGPLIPFGAVEKRRLGGKRIIMRFAYVTPVRRDVEMSIERGRREVEAKLPQFKSHAFAYDGYAWYSGQAHPVQADRTDALFVEINDGTMEASIRLAQAYRRSMSGGFNCWDSQASRETISRRSQHLQRNSTRCWPRAPGPTSWPHPDGRLGQLDHLIAPACLRPGPSSGRSRAKALLKAAT